MLEKLSDAGDRAAIEVEAHTLKGAAGAMGFERVAALAKALELDARAAALFENAVRRRKLRCADRAHRRGIPRLMPGNGRASA